MHVSRNAARGDALSIVAASASPPWPYGRDAPSIAAHIVELTKTLARTTPPPPDQPYFGLDALDPLPVPLLERLTATGIFRKYEFVLELATELGAAARWLARGHGCRVLGIAPTAAAATAAGLLTRRAALTGQVGTVVSDGAHLSVRAGTFTHVWSIDGLLHLRDPAPLFAEAFRVLRGGGRFSAQETVATEPRCEPGVDHVSATAQQYVEALRTAGFVDIRAEDMSGHVWETPLALEGARAKLLQRIAEEHGRGCPYLQAYGRRAAIAAARRRGLLRTYHFTAAHPGRSP